MIKRFVYLLALSLLFSSCQFLQNTFSYKRQIVEFMDTLIQEQDYDKCLNMLALEHEGMREIEIDTLKSEFQKVRTLVITHFGKDLKYNLIGSQKTYFQFGNEEELSNTTMLEVEIHNGKHLGALQVIFDDNSNKIYRLDLLSIKMEIPDTTRIWIFSILGFLVLIFNLFVIRLVWKSNLKRKWLKYIAIIIFNFPSIQYVLIDGINFKFLRLHLFGFGGDQLFLAYVGMSVGIGLPLGGLYWFFKLWFRKTRIEEDSDFQMPDILDEA